MKGTEPMCVLGEHEYPGFPKKITGQHLVLMLVAPMSQAGTLSSEEMIANVNRATRMAHRIEAETGHTVLVPHLDLLVPPPPNGKTAWEIIFDKYAHLLRSKCDGIYQMPYDCQQDVECVSLVGWWHQNRASILIYRNLSHIPKLRQLAV